MATETHSTRQPRVQRKKEREIILAIIDEHAGHVAEAAKQLAHSAERIATLLKEVEALEVSKKAVVGRQA